MNEFVHWVEGGDIDIARKFGLTLLASCGQRFIPHATGARAARPSCPDCEAIGGPISRPKRLGVEDRPHYVYRHYNADGVLLYVGCTVDPRLRTTQHQANSWWFPQVYRSRLIVFPNRLHALRVERDSIAAERPMWNVRHQDFSNWSQVQVRAAQRVAGKHQAPTSVLRRLSRWEKAS